MNYQLACLSVLSVFTLLGFVALLNGRPDWLLWQLLAAMALGGFNWYVGTLVFPIKVTTGFAVVYLMWHADTWARNLQAHGNGLLWIFLGAVVVSVAMAFIISPPPGPVYSQGLQSRQLRPFVQAYTYASMLSIFPLALTALDSKRKLLFFCNWYMALALMSAVAGLVQLVMYHSGREFMPILRWNSSHSEMAAFSVGAARVQRLYGFAGEPKALAYFLMPALFMLFTSLAADRTVRRSWWSRWWVLVTIGVTFVFTFSTAALIAAGFGLFFLARIMSSRGMGAVLALVVGVGVLASALQVTARLAASGTRADAEEHAPALSEVLHKRVVGRLSEEGKELYEVRALEYLFRRKPEALLAGLGPGMYVFHLGTAWENGKGVEPINSGWVALLMDLGILGVGVVSAWIYRIWQRHMAWVDSFKSRDAELFNVETVSLASFGAAVCLHAGFGALSFICLFAGVLDATQRQSHQRMLPSSGEAGRAVCWKRRQWLLRRQSHRKEARARRCWNREHSITP